MTRQSPHACDFLSDGILVFAHAASNDPQAVCLTTSDVLTSGRKFWVSTPLRGHVRVVIFGGGAGGWGGLITFIAVRSLTLLHIRHAT